MTIGVVYCAVCESYPGRCKIGKTFRNAAQRIAELQRHYRSHRPFVEHDNKLVDHYGRVEWLAHQRLAHCREPATEMFVCTPDEAMAAIAWATQEALRNPPSYKPRPQRAPKRWQGRGAGGGHRHWRLIFVAAAAMIVVGLIRFQPAIPDWLPDQMQRACLWIERWG